MEIAGEEDFDRLRDAERSVAADVDMDVGRVEREGARKCETGYGERGARRDRKRQED
jgi:hypothetical protein